VSAPRRVLGKAEQLTRERHQRREREKTKRGATYGAHEEGRAVCEKLLPDLAQFMVSREAPRPPHGLERIVRQLSPEELALIALSPFLHGIAVGRRKDDASPAMHLKLTMGRVLRAKCKRKRLLKRESNNRYRQLRWSDEQYVRAGHWLQRCVVKKFEDFFFFDDQDDFPCLTKAGEHQILNQIYPALIYRNPMFIPSTAPIRDWTGWRSGGYWDDGSRISATFVRDAHPETKRAIERIFRNGGCEHIDGTNILQRVYCRINTKMIPVVERFAGKVGKKVSALQVVEDVTTARLLGEKRFQVPLSCDFRGRIYGVPHFNFQREDHVRSQILFADPLPIGDDFEPLMIHAANTGDFDKISKRPFAERVDWAIQHRDMITRIAKDPEATVGLWREADAPFSFVAGCMELTSAWKEGASYETRLPIPFDGQCNGIQHLAMMMRDQDAGFHVNLIPGDIPQDVYELILKRVIDRIRAELDDWTRRTKRIEGKEVLLKPRGVYARYWVDKLNRKLIKRPAMTFPYSVTIDGMKDQIDEVYAELHEFAEPTDGASYYLAWRIMTAAKEILPRPAKAMEFIRKLAEERADKGEILQWENPTGFPVANRHFESKVKLVHIESRGEYVRHFVADGYEPNVLKEDAMNAAAPNFVHSLDAALMARVAIAADRKGIPVFGVHDSMAFRAPEAQEGRVIINEEFARLYAERDVLDDLRNAAGSNLALPEKGSLDPLTVRFAPYAFA
jgi:DNA-directed RNA polymerase